MSRIFRVGLAMLVTACSCFLMFAVSAGAQTTAPQSGGCSHAGGDPHCGVLTVHGGKASGGYSWKAYVSGSTTAYDALTVGKHAVCDKNCRNNLHGDGKYNWKGTLPSCKKSSYIWAKVNKKTKHVNEQGYSQSSKAVVASLPKTAKNSKNDLPYKDYIADLKDNLHQLNPSDYVTVICSAGLP